MILLLLFAIQVLRFKGSYSQNQPDFLKEGDEQLDMIYYQIQIQTSPNNALYEATVQVSAFGFYLFL